MTLQQLREDPSLWGRFAFSPEEPRSEARYRILLELQYDRQPDDRPLLRYLLEQETVAREEDDWSGTSQALYLAGWLLARFREVEDSVLFARAKWANFDTSCGFDVEYVLSAGVSRVKAYLEAAGEDELLEWLAEYDLTEQDIEDWFEARARDYPTRVELEDLWELIGRHAELGEREKAIDCLDRWERTAEPTWENLVRLRFMRRELGQLEEAIAVSRRLLEMDARERGTLVALLREVGRTEEAFRHLQAHAFAVRQDGDWSILGTGRMLAEECFSLALAGVRSAFELGQELLAQGLVPTIHILELASAAAESFGESGASYGELARQERERLGL